MNTNKTILLSLFLFICFQITNAQTTDELSEMSIDDLLNMEITTVSKVGEGVATAPAVLTIIDREMIKNNGYRTVYDALRNVPGFWPIQDVNDDLLGVRGVHASTSQKFLLLINGKKITENLWNYTDIDYNISLLNVKRIEVIRGPGSATYGRAALTAVINVVTLDGSEIDGLMLDVSLGNYGYKKLGFSYGTSNSKGDKVEFYGHMVGTGGEAVSLPAAEDGAKNRINGEEIIDKYNFPTGAFGARFHNDSWDLNVHYQMRTYQQQRAADGQFNWQDLKTGDVFNSSYTDVLLGEEHNFLVADLQHNFKLGEINNSISLNYTYSRHRMRENPVPLRDLTLAPTNVAEQKYNLALGEMFETEILSYRYGIEYSGDTRFSNMISAVWGLEANSTVPFSDKFTSNFKSIVANGKLTKQLNEFGYLRESPNGTFDDMRTEYLFSGFAEFKIDPIKNVKLSIGGRFDYHVKGDDFAQKNEANRYPDPLSQQKRDAVEKATGEFSPRLSAVFTPFGNNDLIAKLIYNKSFIAPAYFYRYADPSTSYAGGPWLKAETLQNFMLSLQTVQKNYHLQFVAYLNINKNLLTRDITLTPARYTSLEDELAMHGIEIDGVYNAGDFSIHSMYSFSKGNETYTEAGSKSWIMSNGSIKNFPVHNGNIGATLHLLNKQLNITVNERWNGEIITPLEVGLSDDKKADGSAQTVAETSFKDFRTLDPMIVTDLTVRFMPNILENLEISLSVYNAFDQDVWHGGTVKRPYKQAGRWYNFNIVQKF